MASKTQVRYFDEGDVELLESVLSMIPGLDLVAYAAKRARGKVSYPIREHSDLLPMFDKSRAVRFRDQVISFELAVRFIPREFFPIRSERDLLCKVLLAVQRGITYHLLSDGASSARGAGDIDLAKVAKLPSPRPATLDDLNTN